MGNKIALLIGVSKYENGLDPLPAAAKDIVAMQEVLEHPEIGGFQVTTLINETRQKTEEAIFKLFDNRKKEDLLLLFFSGHGVKDDNSNLFLAARNTRKDDNRLVTPTAIAASYIQETMKLCSRTRKVVILDCCFSGAFPAGMTIKDDGSLPIAQQLGGEGWAVLTSSTSLQYSFELPGFDLSVYTHFLVEGMRTGIADRDRDGAISVEELHAYAKEKVLDTAPEKMTPEIYPSKEGGKILLATVPQKHDPELIYRQELENRLRNGTLTFAARALLDRKIQVLGLTSEQATAIESTVLKPFREYAANLYDYEKILTKTLAAENPPSPENQLDLQDLAADLGLKDEDVAALHQRLSRSSLPSRSVSPPNIQVTPPPTPAPEEMTHLRSERGVDYTRLRDLLKSGEWKQADQETYRLMITTVGKKEGQWFDRADLENFPCEDLKTLDQLWVKYSNGKWGFSVQKKIWQECGSPMTYNDEWEKFGDRVGWRKDGKWIELNHFTFDLQLSPPGEFPIWRVWDRGRGAGQGNFSFLAQRLVNCSTS